MHGFLRAQALNLCSQCTDYEVPVSASTLAGAGLSFELDETLPDRIQLIGQLLQLSLRLTSAATQVPIFFLHTSQPTMKVACLQRVKRADMVGIVAENGMKVAKGMWMIDVVRGFWVIREAFGCLRRDEILVLTAM